MLHFEFSVRAVFSNSFKFVFLFCFGFNADFRSKMETIGGKDALVAYSCQVLDLALYFFFFSRMDGVLYQFGKGACG